MCPCPWHTCGGQRQLVGVLSFYLEGPRNQTQGSQTTQSRQRVPLATELALQTGPIFPNRHPGGSDVPLHCGLDLVSSWPVVLGILSHGYCWYFLPHFHREVVDGSQGQVHSGCNADCSRSHFIALSLGFPICNVERTLSFLLYCI